MKSNLLHAFNSLCEEVYAAEDKDDQEMEKSYEKLLVFLRTNQASRELLSSKICETVKSYRNIRRTGYSLLSVDAIAYCMHELRWLEVRDVAMQEQDEYFSARREDFLWRLIDAFESN